MMPHRLHRCRAQALLTCITLLVFVPFMLRRQLLRLDMRSASLVRVDLNSVYQKDMRDLELYSLQSSTPSVPQDVWKNGIDYEMNFWGEWLRTKGDKWPEDYARRQKDTLPFLFEQYLKRNTTNRVLNVGAGPLHGEGFWAHGAKIELFPIDPLAKQYITLLRKHQVLPLVQSIEMKGEEIREVFAYESFDFVYSINALDHALSPLKCITNMIAVLKSGCHLIIKVHPNEGENGGYVGFHQHNFNLGTTNQHLLLSGKHYGSIPLDLTVHFARVMKIDCWSGDPAKEHSKSVITCHGVKA